MFGKFSLLLCQLWDQQKMLWTQQLPSYRKSTLECGCIPINLTYKFQLSWTCRDWLACKTANCSDFRSPKKPLQNSLAVKSNLFHLPGFKNFSKHLLVKYNLTCRFCNENPQLHISETIFYIHKNMSQKFCQWSFIDWAKLTPSNP